MSVKQIDQALGRYYARYNQHYFDDQSKGLFQAWVEDNGFDTDAIVEELNVGADDCTLVEFDDKTFPFGSNQLENKNQAIYDIIKRCYEDPDAYMISPRYDAFTITKQHFIIATDEKEENQKIHEFVRGPLKLHCRTIFEKGQTDTVFFKLLFIGQQNIGKPYLQLLADLYARDRITHYLQIQIVLKEYETKIQKLAIRQGDEITVRKLDVSSWARFNKHTLTIQNMSDTQTEYDLVTHAIRAYYHRLCPLLGVVPNHKIQDNYQHVCEYIEAAIDFVHYTAKNQEGSCPFQYDCCFAFGDVESCNKSISIHQEDSDDDDEDYKQISNAKPSPPYFYDCFGNIKNRLENAQLLYVSQETDVAQTKNRIFHKQFDTFKKDIKTKYSNKEYPRRFRFLSVLDRRKPNSDELIFFEAGKDSAAFPPIEAHCDDVWNFHSSNTCIIPEVLDKDKYDEKEQNILLEGKYQLNADYLQQKKKLQTQAINTSHPMKNGMLVLSFHVITVEEIRCYLYLAGCMFRFLAEDLGAFLAQFFVGSEENVSYLKSDELKELIENVANNLIDLRFETFYKENKINIQKMRTYIKHDVEEIIEQKKIEQQKRFELIEETKLNYKQEMEIHGFNKNVDEQWRNMLQFLVPMNICDADFLNLWENKLQPTALELYEFVITNKWNQKEGTNIFEGPENGKYKKWEVEFRENYFKGSMMDEFLYTVSKKI